MKGEGGKEGKMDNRNERGNGIRDRKKKIGKKRKSGIGKRKRKLKSEMKKILVESTKIEILFGFFITSPTCHFLEGLNQGPDSSSGQDDNPAIVNESFRRQIDITT